MRMMAMIGTTVLTAGASVLSSEQKRMQQIAQGVALENQANLTRQPNELMKARGDLEARNIDKQKISCGASSRRCRDIIDPNSLQET